MKPCKIGILLGQKSNNFWLDMKKAYETLSPQFAVQAIYAWPCQGDEEKTQLTELRKMVAGRLHGIIVNPLTRYNLSPGICEAANRKVPIFDVGAKADPASVSAAGPFYIPVKTVDFYRQGVLGASYIVQNLHPETSGKVAIIEGDRESTQSIERSRGAADTFKSESGICLIERISADFNRQKAVRVSSQILDRHPDLAAVFCANDHMALGVAQTVSQSHLDRKPIIVGVDLIEEAKPAIRAGLMDASVSFSAFDVADALLKAVIRRMNGDTTIVDTYLVDSLLVDRQSLLS